MVQATIKMVMPPGRVEEALQMLQSIAGRTRVEAGCIDCSIHRDSEQEHVLVFEQVWRCEEELLRHLGSDEYRNVLLIIEMCTEQPVIRFDTISGSTGVETIEAARRSKKDE